MKYAILIGDGMADNPIASLGGKTPLEYANTPNMDRMAGGKIGLYKSVPDGFPPGSDVASMSIFGYDPRKYYSGRAPLEAASIGVELKPGEVAFRCNLVSFTKSGDSFVMKDYSAGHITTDEAGEIIKTLDEKLSSKGVRFYTGKSYRHLMVMPGGPAAAKTTPPHDISDKVVSPYFPGGDGAERLLALMDESRGILKDHPVNAKRRAAGKNTADSIWLWGQGMAPKLPTLKDTFGISGSIISAVDLLNGLGRYAGLEVINVPGITGYIDTDYDAKASYALRSLEDKDFVCVHVEAPDEAGHQGLLKEKLQAIEDFDKKVVGRMIEGMKKFGDYRVMVISDHPTPVELKTHTPDPVPFAVYEGNDSGRGLKFSEKDAKSSGLFIDDQAAFMAAFIKR